MDEVRWLDKREERAWRAMQVMQMQLTARLGHELAASSNLSYQDYLVLVALTDQPDGRLRLFELGRAVGWEKSRISHHVTRMEDRGLVCRQSCPSDRRGAYVNVTSLGRREIVAAAPGHLETVRRLFIDQLTSRQLDTIAIAAERVLAALSSDGCGGDSS